MSETLNSAQYRALQSPAKANKYRAKKMTVDGIVFDSQAEARYYGKLNMQAASGEITGFDRQVPFPLIVNGKLIATYIADFLVHYPDGSQKVVDIKGMRKGAAWDMFRIKQKLMAATLGIEVITVK